MGKPETAAKNRYAKKHYDRLPVFVPLSDGAWIRSLAATNGMSLNEFVCRAVYRYAAEVIRVKKG